MRRYQIAGHVVGFDGATNAVAGGCAAYAYEGTRPTEVVFSVSEDEFKRECNAWIENNRGEIEAWMLAKSMFAWLTGNGAMMLHASVVEMDNKAYIFTAPSGTGKSTHANLWIQHFGKNRARILNDDKPLVRLDERGDFLICGSPWCGKEGLNINAEVPIKAICMLEQAPINEIAKIDSSEAAPFIIGQVYLPDKQEQMDKALDLVDKLLINVPIFRLRCKISEDAVQMAYDAMSGENKK